MVGRVYVHHAPGKRRRQRARIRIAGVRTRVSAIPRVIVSATAAGEVGVPVSPIDIAKVGTRVGRKPGAAIEVTSQIASEIPSRDSPRDSARQLKADQSGSGRTTCLERESQETLHSSQF